MPHVAPEFPFEISDESMERILEFVLHYDWQLAKEGVKTGHQKAQRALIRRMLLDLGLDWETVTAKYSFEQQP